MTGLPNNAQAAAFIFKNGTLTRYLYSVLSFSYEVIKLINWLARAS